MDAQTGNQIYISVQHLVAWLCSIDVETVVKIKKKRAKKGKKYPGGVQAEEDRDIEEVRLEYNADAQVDENLIFRLLCKTISGHDGIRVKLDPAPKRKRCVAYVVQDS